MVSCNCSEELGLFTREIIRNASGDGRACEGDIERREACKCQGMLLQKACNLDVDIFSSQFSHSSEKLNNFSFFFRKFFGCSRNCKIQIERKLYLQLPAHSTSHFIQR